MSDERKTRDHTAASSPTEAASEPVASGSAESAAESTERPDRDAEVRTATTSTTRSSSPGSRSADSGATPEDVTDSGDHGRAAASAKTVDEPGVYFFTDRVVTEAEAREMLASDSPEDRAEVISRLLTYAEYDEIWAWTDRDAVCELFDRLDLPDRLRAAWARNLGLVAQPG